MDSLRRKNNSVPSQPNRAVPFRREPFPSITPKNIPTNNSPQRRAWLSPHVAKKASKKQWFRCFLWISFIIILIGIGLFAYLSWKVGKATRTMSIAPKNNSTLSDTMNGAASFINPIIHSKQISLQGESDGRTNILLLGKSNDHTAGQKLTDTIMVMSLDFNHHKVAILSLPRDLFVEVPEISLSTKLNALYQYDMKSGSNATILKKTITNITGLPIHYFAVLDYDGFKHIVDTLGGISIYVEHDIYDAHYPGPHYNFETFEILKGWHDMDGEMALKYVRERHGDTEGDFGRSKRQQDVLKSLRNKALSLKTLLNPFTIGDIIDALGQHIRTDLSLDDMKHLLLLVDTFDTNTIETAIIDAWKKESILRVSHVQVGSIAMFVLVPRTGDWSETREIANHVFDLEYTRNRKNAIRDEKASLIIVNRSKDLALGNRILKLLKEDFNMSNTHLMSANILTDTNAKTSPLETSLLMSLHPDKTPYTLNELKEKLSVSIQDDSLPFETDSITFDPYDIVLVLGNDLAKRFAFEEDTSTDIQNAENNLEYQKNIDKALREMSAE